MAKRKPRKRDIENYAHTDKERVNNPPVGLVTPETDKDAARKTYAHDPHIDPQLFLGGQGGAHGVRGADGVAARSRAHRSAHGHGIHSYLTYLRDRLLLARELFGMPIAVAKGAAIRDWLDARGIRLVAASPQAASDYAAMDLRGHIAFAVGSESGGLEADWLADAASARIPMAGRVDSVNAATAAALLLFEARRQRASGAASIPAIGRAETTP